MANKSTNKLTDRIVFNAVFNIISIISLWTLHLPILSWRLILPVRSTILFPKQWLLFHIIIVETINSGERGMDPCPITVMSSRVEISQARDRTKILVFYLKSFTMPTELYGLDFKSKST